MKALLYLAICVALAGLTLWHIAGGRLDPECLSDAERVTATALHDSSTCVKAFP